MPEETVIDQAGIARTPAGAIASMPTSSATPPETTTSTPKTEPESPPKTEATSSDGKQTQAPEKGKDESLLSKKTEPKVAPEKYEAFTLPEGFEANEAMMNEATALFKDLGLPQGEAQRIIDLYAKNAQAAAQAPMDYWQEMQRKWTQEVVSDKTLGTGSELRPIVKETLAKAIDSLGPLADPFREAMALTGAGNHPDVVRALFALGERLTEGKHVAGNGPSRASQSPTGRNERPSAAAALYPNLP